jgi:metal iron transporter
VDAFTILLVYNPKSRMFLIRPFELFIAVIVMVVFCLFVVELTKISAPVGEVFKGFLPSRGVFVGQGYVHGAFID